MLLQTNSYVVPREKRAEHARMVRKFRQTLNRLGCDQFDIFEQVGANWAGGETSGRFVQMMRFRDRKHQLAVQAAEKADAAAQQLIAEFCELINFPYQQQQGLFAVGFYQSVLPVAPPRHELHGEPAVEAGEAVVEEPSAAGLRMVEQVEEVEQVDETEQVAQAEQVADVEQVADSRQAVDVEQVEAVEEEAGEPVESNETPAAATKVQTVEVDEAHKPVPPTQQAKTQHPAHFDPGEPSAMSSAIDDELELEPEYQDQEEQPPR